MMARIVWHLHRKEEQRQQFIGKVFEKNGKLQLAVGSYEKFLLV
jgi:hypothetical protein